MPDNLDITQPEDPQKVNVNQSHEVRYWCKRFGCTEAQLRAAVAAAGVSVDAVQRYLQRR